jgi:hypothetical protein
VFATISMAVTMDITDKRISELTVYSTFPANVGGDVTIKLEGVPSPLGFWVGKAVGGYSSILSVLETAYATGQRISISYDNDKKWPGNQTYDLWKIYSVTVKPLSP